MHWPQGASLQSPARQRPPLAGCRAAPAQKEMAGSEPSSPHQLLSRTWQAAPAPPCRLIAGEWYALCRLKPQENLAGSHVIRTISGLAKKTATKNAANCIEQWSSLQQF